MITDTSQDVVQHYVVEPAVYNSSNVRSRGQRERVSIPPVGSSMTKQADLSRANIHSILAKFRKTGLLPQRVSTPIDPDAPLVDDYQLALNKVISAQRHFDSLPVKVREKFHNDPSKLLRFIENPDNREEAVKLGLVKAPAEPRQPVTASGEGGVATDKEQEK